LVNDFVQIIKSGPQRRESMVSALPVSGLYILPATVGACLID
jgi:hypothetical protein